MSADVELMSLVKGNARLILDQLSSVEPEARLSIALSVVVNLMHMENDSTEDVCDATKSSLKAYGLDGVDGTFQSVEMGYD